jgi:Tfp pilus assembly pilus retraction ATPase PilT
MPQRPLSELAFVDIYVCLEGDAKPHYNGSAGKILEQEIDIPEEFLEDVQRLTEYLREHFVENEMGLTFEGVRLRAAKVRTAGGLLWAAMRKVNTVPPQLDKLGFPTNFVPHLRAMGKREGLILICGSTGQGKTTTSASLLTEFLSTYGGVAFCIEDPVEYDMEGRRGKAGYCYQVEVQEDHEWADMLKRSLRWHPRYIFVGEIRTPDAANQLLRAATSGHLVMTTVHAGSIEEALEGLLQLAEQALGDRATLLLATGLVGVVHQTITSLGLQASFPRKRESFAE